MSYSDRAYELAQVLGAKAAENLREAGYTVTKDAKGRFVVAERPETTTKQADKGT